MSAAELREIGVGMLGYAFMGKTHSNAYRKLAYMTWSPPLVPRVFAIFGRNEDGASEAAHRYGYERSTTDWRQLVDDDAIQLFDNGGPNSLHAEPTIAACPPAKFEGCMTRCTARDPRLRLSRMQPSACCRS
jgi:predicted dehydrogenase